MHCEYGEFVEKMEDKKHYMYDNFIQFHLTRLNGINNQKKNSQEDADEWVDVAKLEDYNGQSKQELKQSFKKKNSDEPIATVFFRFSHKSDDKS